MPTYNVLVGVVDLIDAPTSEDAIQEAERRVRAAGFETFDDGTSQLPHAFESEKI